MDDPQKTLADLKARQLAGERMPCPRCGRDAMKTESHIGALSRRADVFVCDDFCGTDEAIREMTSRPLPFDEWAYFIQERGGARRNGDEL